jgi:CHAT domain-containing protein
MDVEQEARSVARLLELAGVAVELRVGSEAGMAALREGARVAAHIHLCGHAVYRAEHPEFSALRLADRWVSARDFASLPLAGASVVLSACETGPRGAVGGEEVLGLVRGLDRAGTRAVISSLWRVDDRATLGLMEDLYRAWRKAGALGAALRDVQRCRAMAGEDLYLWAPFCLQGEPDVSYPDSRPVPARPGVQFAPEAATSESRS